MVAYNFTNESLDAIMTGLEISEGDRVLAICGSGDQAFAMAEFAEEVVALDTDYRQINYAKKRARVLREEGETRFLQINGHMSFSYFRKSGRLKKIRANIGRVTIEKGDIFKRMIADGMRFNKFYLSNAIEHYNGSRADLFEEIIPSLNCGSLIYSARYHPSLLDMEGLETQDKLSILAQSLETESTLFSWTPHVLVKTN